MSNEQQYPDDLVEVKDQTVPVDIKQYDPPAPAVNIDPGSSVGMYQQVQPILQQAQDQTIEGIRHDIGPDGGLSGGVNTLAKGIGHLFNPTSLTDPSKVGAEGLSNAVVDSIRQTVPGGAQGQVNWNDINNTIKGLPPDVQRMVYKDQYTADKQFQQARIIRQTNEEAQYMATLPFFMPQRMIMGNIVRGTNPELMDRVRIDDERLDRSDILKGLDQIAPPLYLGSDVVQKKVQSLLTNVGGPGEEALNKIAPIAGFVAGLGTDLMTDPMQYLTFFGEDVAKAGAEVSKEGDFVKIIMPNSEAVYMDAEKNLYRVQPDLKQTENNLMKVSAGPLQLVVKGDKVQTYSEAIKNVMANAQIGWGKAAIRPGVFLQGLQTNTSNEAFNMARNINRNEIGLGQMVTEGDMADHFKMILGDKPLTEGVSRYATLLSEVGADGADKVASRMGIKLSGEDKLLASNLSQSVQDWRDWARVTNFHMTGDMVPAFKPASPQEILEAINSDKNIKALWENMDPELRPYMFSLNADVGRRASNEALKAMREMGEGYNAVDSTASTYGVKRTADAFKERDKLSTWAADLLKSKEYNVKNFYDTNLLGTAQAQVRDIISTAANKKFAKFSIELGKTRQEWDSAINGARALVEQNGIANVHPDVFRLSRLDPAIMEPVSKSAFNDLQGVAREQANLLYGKNVTPELGFNQDRIGFENSIRDVQGNPTVMNPEAPQGPNRFRFSNRDDILFEPSVAGAINAKFSPEAKKGLTAMFSWYNSLLTRSGLSGVGRIVPQTYEAFTSAGLRPRVQDYVESVKSAMTPINKKDFAGKFFEMSGLGQNVSKMDDVGRVTISPKMLEDPTINDAWTESMKDLKAMIETKQFDKPTSQYLKDALMKTKDVAEYAYADHWLKTKIRGAVNGFEDIPKEALFRKYLNDYGDPNKAAMQVGKEMMDFRFTSEGVGKYVKPAVQFANYHVKAMERLLLLAAKYPGSVTAFDDQNGHIVRAIHSMNWSPYNVEAMRRTFKLNSDPVFLQFLPGLESTAQNKDSTQSTINNIINGVLGNVSSISKDSYTQGLVQASKEGFQAMAHLPSYMSGPIDLLRRPFSERGIGQMVTPGINLGVAAITGFDLATGDKIPLSNQKENTMRSYQERLANVLKSTSRPFSDRNFWNIYDGLKRMAFEIHAPKINEALDNPVLQTAYRALGKSEDQAKNDFDKLRIDKDHLSRLINTTTAGLIVTRDGDLAYNSVIRNLMAQRSSYLDEMKKAAINKDTGRVSELRGDIRTLVNKLHQAVDFRDSYETQTYKMRQSPSLEAQKAASDTQFEPTDDQLLQSIVPAQPGEIPNGGAGDSIPDDLTPQDEGGKNYQIPHDLQPIDREPAATGYINNTKFLDIWENQTEGMTPQQVHQQYEDTRKQGPWLQKAYDYYQGVDNELKRDPTHSREELINQSKHATDYIAGNSQANRNPSSAKLQPDDMEREGQLPNSGGGAGLTLGAAGAAMSKVPFNKDVAQKTFEKLRTLSDAELRAEPDSQLKDIELENRKRGMGPAKPKPQEKMRKLTAEEEAQLLELGYYQHHLSTAQRQKMIDEILYKKGPNSGK